MRSKEFPLGKPSLNAAQRRSVDYGNRILKITIRLARAAFDGGVGFAIENPQSSRFWITPDFLYLVSHCNGRLDTNVLDFCQFGEPWRKRTTIVSFASHFRAWRGAVVPLI